MKRIFLVVMAAFSLTAKAVELSFFGPHDPDAQAAFVEVAQNHTGTKTEERYRTAGLNKILDECRKKPKQPIEYLWKTKEFFNHCMERVVRDSEKYRATLSQEEQYACKRLQELFEQACREYKGTTPSHVINKSLIIFDINGGDTPVAQTVTLYDRTVIFINPTSTVFKQYCALFKKCLGVKHAIEDNVKKYIHIINHPETSFLRKKITKIYVGTWNLLLRYVEYPVQVREEEFRAILFHELSHCYTDTLCNHLRNHTVPKSKGIACIEEYCNTLAVLNSPHPLRTARSLHGLLYHTGHIPALAEALEKEGVKN